VNSKSKLPEIRNGAFTEAREKLGLSIKDLAGQACLSSHQIEQIENGGMGSFYSVQIKVTAAKKVAKLLRLSEEDAFNHGEVVELKKEIAAIPVEPKKLEVVEIKQNQEPELEPELEQKQNIEVTPVMTTFSFSALGTLNPKQPPNKRLFIWLSLIVVVVFSVVNLRPLFFPEKLEEMIVAKEEIIEQTVADAKVSETIPASTSAPLMVSAPIPVQDSRDVPANTEACPVADAIVPSYKPSSPRKPADLVYVQAKTKQIVCVVDASGKTQNKTVDSNLGVSFYGAPPFKILSSGLAQVDVYFQGVKVRPANLDGKTILLEAGDISRPAAPTDSQFR
jgi:transcriptional regulator with XRE-family HTH domain